jgi:transcriptional regulator with XRE-family HTH domain
MDDALTGAVESTARLDSDAQQRFGARVRRLRIERGLDQQTVAADVGYSSGSMLCAIEYGDRWPSLYHAIRIARRLDTTLAQLFRGIR